MSIEPGSPGMKSGNNITSNTNIAMRAKKYSEGNSMNNLPRFSVNQFISLNFYY